MWPVCFFRPTGVKFLSQPHRTPVRFLTVGTWLSLVEHSLGVRGVGSSNLPVPTNPFCCCCSRAYEHTHISVLNCGGGFGSCLTNGSEFLWEFSRSPKNGCHFNCSPRKRYTTRKRPTMISRISGLSLSGTIRPDCGEWRSRSTAEKIRTIVRSAYCSESLAM